MKKALIVATVVGFIATFEKNDIRILQNMGYEVHYAASYARINDPKKIKDLESMGIIKHEIDFARNPISKTNVVAYKELVDLMIKEQFDLVHCHTPVAGVLGRLVAHKCHVPTIIYTAHGFHFYKGAPLKNWLFYYPIEWLCAHWTDTLITINKEDFELAKKHLHAKRVEYVPGVGINVTKFAETKVDRSKKRCEVGVPENAILLVSVGELNENKNHSVVIKALAKNGNRNIHYAIAGKGDIADYLTKLASSEGVQDQVHLLGFRDDVNEIYAAADICVFPSIREGLGLAAVEGMACGLPLIVSDNRGTRGFLTEKNAITCRHDDVDAFADAIRRLYEDKDLREKMGAANKLASQAFDVSLINREMMRIYKDQAE